VALRNEQSTSMEHAILLKGHEECSETECKATNGTVCRRVATEGMPPSYAIEDYYLYEVDNVEGIGVLPRDNYGWDVSIVPNQTPNPQNYYFCVDTLYAEVWPHWVDESAIYLLLFEKLKRIYPSLKLYSIKQRQFKLSMYKAFGIEESDVVFSLEGTQNRFVFPYYISLADHRRPFQFLDHMKNFHNYIVSRCPSKEKDIHVLYLPRATKENIRTDHQIPIQAELIQFLSQMEDAKIYYTDDTTNMIEQWDLVRRARLLILNEGGNFGINSFFAENSDILVIGGQGNGCHFENPSPALMFYDGIKRGNRYYNIPYELPFCFVLEYLARVVNNMIEPMAMPTYSCWKKCEYCKYQDYETY
jgi:hypothetical protein